MAGDGAAGAGDAGFGEIGADQPGGAAVVELDGGDGPGGRRRRRPVVVGALIAVVALVAALVVARVADRGADDARLETFAPEVTVGDADVVVVATTSDSYGARTRIPTSVVTALDALPGVESAQGAVRAFVPIAGESLSSAIALSWNGTSGLDLQAGRVPERAGEIAVDVDTLAQRGLGLGDRLEVPAPDAPPERPTAPATIVGAFSVAGGSGGVRGVPLLAFDAVTLLALTGRDGTAGFDRIDIVAAPGADPAAVLATVAAALPPDLVAVPASQLGTRVQLRAELEIQRAFSDLLDPHEPTRAAAIEGAESQTAEARAVGAATFDRYASTVELVEFRVQRVSFTDADHASLVFMTYYGDRPSPVLDQPFDAEAVRVDSRWQVSSRTVCTLTILGGAPCVPQAGGPADPPPGWQRPQDHPGIAEVLEQFAAADATVERRVALVDQGAPQQATIEAGWRADAPFVGRASLLVSGVRLVDAEHAQLFYSLTGTGDPSRETPYPLAVTLVRVDGAWKLPAGLACGLRALASRDACVATSAPVPVPVPVAPSGSVPAASATTVTSAATTTTR